VMQQRFVPFHFHRSHYEPPLPVKQYSNRFARNRESEKNHVTHYNKRIKI
jgi:hypothetical protein